MQKKLDFFIVSDDNIIKATKKKACHKQNLKRRKKMSRRQMIEAIIERIRENDFNMMHVKTLDFFRNDSRPTIKDRLLEADMLLNRKICLI